MLMTRHASSISVWHNSLLFPAPLTNWFQIFEKSGHCYRRPNTVRRRWKTATSAVWLRRCVALTRRCATTASIPRHPSWHRSPRSVENQSSLIQALYMPFDHHFSEPRYLWKQGNNWTKRGLLHTWTSKVREPAYWKLWLMYYSYKIHNAAYCSTTSCWAMY